MKHTISVRYPAPAAVVMRMFTDPEFHTRKLDGMGLKNYTVLDQQTRGDDFSIRIERKMPVQLPGLKKGAGETTVTNEERWNRKTHRGGVSVQLQGMPLEMSCESAMTDEGDGCVINYDWNVRSKIPLIGGKIEKFVIADMERRFAEETAAAIALLDDYRK